MTKTKRIFLAVSTVILSLCIAFSVLFLALLSSSDKSVKAAESTDLNGTMWVLNDTLVNTTGFVGEFSLRFNFSCPDVVGGSYIAMFGNFSSSSEVQDVSFSTNNGSTRVYSVIDNPQTLWTDSKYKWILISDVSPLTSEELSVLIAFLDVNAVPYGETPPSADYEQGYSDGYADGYNKGLSDSLDNPVSFFLSPLDSFMSIDLFGNFSVGDVFSVILFVSLGLIVIKMFAGG